MKYKLAHETRYTYSNAVPICHNIVHLRPRETPHQSFHDFRMIVHPEPFDLHESTDAFGNSETYFSIEQAHMGLTVSVTSQVEVTERSVPSVDAEQGEPWQSIADQLRQPENPTLIDAARFLYASPRAKPLGDLREYAASSFTSDRSVLEASLDLTGRIHKDFAYDARATNVSTPIETVFRNRRGVCQDFAHLQIACLRSLGLACRYVSGYMRTYPPEGQPRLRGCDASHAWVSVYSGDAGWIDFDPTNNLIPNEDYITLAWGRDYSDVCPIRGVILGGGEHRMGVSVDVEPVETTG